MHREGKKEGKKAKAEPSPVMSPLHLEHGAATSSGPASTEHPRAALSPAEQTGNIAAGLWAPCAPRLCAPGELPPRHHSLPGQLRAAYTSP